MADVIDKILIGQYLEVLWLSLKLSGRFSRRQYIIALIWIFASLILISNIISMGSYPSRNFYGEPSVPEVISIHLFMGTIIIFIGASVRRYHDLDKSGWHVIFLIVPIIGTLYFIFLLIDEGKEIGQTRWG